jgi:hypothetical protein
MKRQRRLPYTAPVVGERFRLVGVATRRPIDPFVYCVASDGRYEIVGREATPTRMLDGRPFGPGTRNAPNA